MRWVLGTVWVAVVVTAACGGTSTNGPGKATGGDERGGTPSNGASTSEGGGKSPGGGVAGSIDTGGTGNTGAIGAVSGGGTSPVAGAAPVAGAPSSGGVGDGGGRADGGTGPGGESNQGGDQAMGGDGGAGGGNHGPEIQCSCAVDKACVRVTVQRDAVTTRQPWVVWPAQADGVGDLRVNAVSDQYKFQDRATVPGASFVAADASYGVALCVPSGSTHIRAFLDDNEDEDPNAVSSSDYLDSCATGSAQCFRCFDLNVTAGSKTDLTIELRNSCD
jgi:hypothetical protein